MASTMLDFWKCEYRFLGNKFNFRVVKFNMNGVDHDTTDENIFNDFITVYFNDFIDVDELKITGVTNIEFDPEDSILTINGDRYIVDADEFKYFVDDMGGDFNQCVGNIMKHFIEYFTENLGRDI